MQTLHLEVFLGNELTEILQIYGFLVPAIFFADQSDKLLKWCLFPALPSFPDLLVFVAPDLTLVRF